jgi:hypothetical protein
MVQGRNRERRREAAGRRNEPEAVPRKMSWQKKAGVLNCVDRCSIRGTERTGRVTIATGSTTVLDSSGSCDGERRMAVASALGDCG